MKREEIEFTLNVYQSVIARMATNSSSCKTWCITVVAAILVFAAREDSETAIAVAFLPILMFAGLDTYYLSLERSFREKYSTLVSKVHKFEFATTDAYSVAPARKVGESFSSFAKAFLSPSVLIFYLTLSLGVLLLRMILACL